MWALVGIAVSLLAPLASDKPAVKRPARIFVCVFLALFLILAGVDVVDIVTCASLAENLADRQRAARKRYVEWWTYCEDGNRATEVERESEVLREQIRSLLRAKVRAAEAEYFNTPKAAEPFPDTTIRNCPQAVRINEWAHRIDRLGEIIQRVRSRKT